ncbi:MAG: NADH-quinone oxidoreductase subunit NuoG [Anaerolineaceae bacterium]
MTKQVTLTIDKRSVTAPAGMMVVDAAKKVGIKIPTFCYHPKMEPVGMCRMCLVEIGKPVIDRVTGQVQMDENGAPKIQYAPKLETACTTPVSEGMVVITDSEKVIAARKEMLEFFLTSHPLDCPVCDKGGECPLQNLTMQHGPGVSRFIYDDKKHLGKQIPLGELIILDRERCIQCGRCVRFQHELVDDPVIAFCQRGRSIEIITQSQPGFDSIFSGNTTDICPVGALTTIDFRFGARPWEMNQAASICNHCAVNCNITYNTRREAKSDGRTIIKRVMPRQNEQVNEIWMCDKGRFAYHYSESPERLTQPMVRKDGFLQPVDWEEAMQAVDDNMKFMSVGMLTIAGGRLSNEDLFNLAVLTRERAGTAVLYTDMAGGDIVEKVGFSQGSNLAELGKGDTILVVACDLHEEAPIWWLRVKQAAERGATLIVVNPRKTRLEKYATHIIRYEYGEEVQTIAGMTPGTRKPLENAKEAAEAFVSAQNAIVIFGSEGIGLTASAALAAACGDLLKATGHTGKPNNGLLPAWSNGNTQGAWEMGFRPDVDLKTTLKNAKVVTIAGADPSGDDPELREALSHAKFVVVQDMFLTETAMQAHVVLPVQAMQEREGTYTSGERRVQRFYQAIEPLPGTRPDYALTAEIAQKMDIDISGQAASLVFDQIAREVPVYTGLDYQKLAESPEQWPPISRSDLYYGGTEYDNHQGIGVQLSTAADRGESLEWGKPSVEKPSTNGLRIFPVTRLYDRGSLMQATSLLDGRKAPLAIRVHPLTAKKYQLSPEKTTSISVGARTLEVAVILDEDVPHNVALLPRSV